jgi:hypothetical protein
MIILEGNFLPDLFSLAEHPDFVEITASWEPTHFKWGIFIIGIAIICVGFFLTIRRGFQTKQK